MQKNFFISFNQIYFGQSLACWCNVRVVLVLTYGIHFEEFSKITRRMCLAETELV